MNHKNKRTRNSQRKNITEALHINKSPEFIMQCVHPALCAILAIILVISALSLSGCTKANLSEPLSVTDFKLNTVVQIKVYNNVSQDILDNCLNLCDQYDLLLSRTNEESTLYKVNHQELTVIPAELGDLINEGIKYSKLSNGAFDIAIASVSSLWNFTAENPSVPNANDISDALQYVDYSTIKLTKNNDDTNTYTISIPDGVMIDLGAIAKGYIADKIGDYLVNNGVKSATINLGGNVLCIGQKDVNKDFIIGIRKPFSETGESLCNVSINGKSVVSSGTYERCFEYDGNFYHHILNPSTGYPYNNGLTSVSIISDKSLDGDCLSTTCFAMGLDAGMELINSIDGVEAVFVDDTGKLYYSNNFKQYIK